MSLNLNARSAQVATETDEPYECVKEEAVNILEEMSQNLQLSFIRLMGFTLSKIFKRLFSSIRVNEDGLMRVRHANSANSEQLGTFLRLLSIVSMSFFWFLGCRDDFVAECLHILFSHRDLLGCKSTT